MCVSFPYFEVHEFASDYVFMCVCVCVCDGMRVLYGVRERALHVMCVVCV